MTEKTRSVSVLVSKHRWFCLKTQPKINFSITAAPKLKIKLDSHCVKHFGFKIKPLALAVVILESSPMWGPQVFFLLKMHQCFLDDKATQCMWPTSTCVYKARGEESRSLPGGGGGGARSGKFLLQWPNKQRGAEKTPGQTWYCSEESPAARRNPRRQRELPRPLSIGSPPCGWRRNNIWIQMILKKCLFESPGSVDPLPLCQSSTNSEGKMRNVNLLSSHPAAVNYSSLSLTFPVNPPPPPGNNVKVKSSRLQFPVSTQSSCWWQLCSKVSKKQTNTWFYSSSHTSIRQTAQPLKIILELLTHDIVAVQRWFSYWAGTDPEDGTREAEETRGRDAERPLHLGGFEPQIGKRD